MRKTLVGIAFAAVMAVPGAAQATESITVGTDDCWVMVDYSLDPGIRIDPSSPPFIYFVMCPGGCMGSPGAGVHCPI